MPGRAAFSSCLPASRSAAHSNHTMLPLSSPSGPPSWVRSRRSVRATRDSSAGGHGPLRRSGSRAAVSPGVATPLLAGRRTPNVAEGLVRGWPNSEAESDRTGVVGVLRAHEPCAARGRTSIHATPTVVARLPSMSQDQTRHALVLQGRTPARRRLAEAHSARTSPCRSDGKGLLPAVRFVGPPSPRL
jgi:hypothetical protein